ncbi:Calcium-dependent phosphotriesterase superfamily protein [Perilla frutescens var. frutescens]|nr:Calcium-dependent phosphotriesterase superfamily protein [Perilla frutescens var. frutescens]
MRYNRVDHMFILLEGEATGRLLRYDPSTKTTHVVEGLVFPNGVQFSKDQSFLLYTENTNCRIMKYLLKGPKTGMTELVANPIYAFSNFILSFCVVSVRLQFPAPPIWLGFSIPDLVFQSVFYD